MRKFILIAFFNLGVIPFISLGLLATLAPGQVWVFRILALIVLIPANVVFYRWLIRLPAYHSASTPRQPIELWLPVLLAIIGTGLVLYRTHYEPHGWWDTWAMWNARGRDYSLAFLEGLPFDLIRLHWTSYEYIPFYPLQLSFLAVFFGDWHMAVPVGLNLFYYWLTVLMIYDCTARGDALVSRLVLTGAALLPYFINIVSDQCADLALASFFAFCVYIYFQHRSPDPARAIDEGQKSATGTSGVLFGSLLIAYFLPSLASIKTEGAILAAGIALLWVLDRRRMAIHPGMILVGAVLPVGLYIFYKLQAGQVHHLADKTGDLTALLLDLPRYAELIKRFIEFHIVLVFGLPLILTITAFWRNPRALLFLIPIIIPLAIYHAIFLITPIEQGFHMDTAYVRITSQMYPAFFLIILFARQEKAELRAKDV